MTRIVGIIPARMGSSRFPGKPLADLLGRPMLEHVYRRAAACPLLEKVFVATCDRAIADAVEAFGGRTVMTSPAHERASDRVAEAARSLPADIIVMIQGDEPMVGPTMISDALSPMRHAPGIGCVNLSAPIFTAAEVRDPNTIKVVSDCNGDALFFSRAAIPWLGEGAFEVGKWHKQVCVIPFRRVVLERFASLPPTPLEVSESIDMLRLVEHGIRVRLVPTAEETHAVDTPEDLEVVAARLGADPFTATYL